MTISTDAGNNHSRQLFRSLLFIPATKLRWIGNGVSAGADALILDLEDAVAEADKPAAREALKSIRAEDHGQVQLLARMNEIHSGHLLEDIQSIVASRCTGVVVPKAESVDDLKMLISALKLIEQNSNRTRPLDVHVMLESAAGIRRAFELGSCDERVKSLMTGTIPDGDVARSVGFTPTRSGLETLYLLSHVQLEGRAAGCATYAMVSASVGHGEEEMQQKLQQARNIGYTGATLIHPSHVLAANTTFGPSDEEIKRAERVLEALEQAHSERRGAVALDGEMIDTAHGVTARATLERASEYRLTASPIN
ncbi:HpcH/HpaI aldolase/citrate lyase family protein [Arthrobacter bambusae]|uniref:HpcH/HpaI aldolase/citrate lyase family protein n=1 Tax=Arthrobacter bambusae TaxID=1338426 RepID=UPI0027808687|nr:CoA ester lyase [Arthrobacter bambusae]MDQ0029075.1 citrate lyase subunit beta/citryl-CoA lyase [Arthrobacter bambusae]MDQ0098523.1 citrate lyase subunit beta/citryl-CoA lyase [Arthrobacter bambusae]